MYPSVKTRKKRRHVGPTCLKIPGENTALPLQISTKGINYHCNYICTMAITIIIYLLIADLFLDALKSYYTLPRFHICGDLNGVIDIIFPFLPGTWFHRKSTCGTCPFALVSL